MYKYSKTSWRGFICIANVTRTFEIECENEKELLEKLHDQLIKHSKSPVLSTEKIKNIKTTKYGIVDYVIYTATYEDITVTVDNSPDMTLHCLLF